MATGLEDEHRRRSHLRPAASRRAGVRRAHRAARGRARALGVERAAARTADRAPSERRATAASRGRMKLGATRDLRPMGWGWALRARGCKGAAGRRDEVL